MTAPLRVLIGCEESGVMRRAYLSVCSGIEAATQAFHPLG